MLELYMIAGGIGAVIFFGVVLYLPFRRGEAKTPEKKSGPWGLAIAYGVIVLFTLPLAIHRFVTGDTEDKILVLITYLGTAIFMGFLIRGDIKRHRK